MKSVVSIMLIMVMASCAMPETEPAAVTDAPTAAAGNAQKVSSISSPDLYAVADARLVKTAHYRFRVQEMNASVVAVEAAIKKFPAHISTSSLSQNPGILENKMVVRVRNEYFQELLNAMGQQAITVDFRNVVTDDVSKEFVDLESRLKTKREVEARYIDVLRKKAGTVEEILEAEKQIGSLHEEIEAAVARLNHLKDQVSYSTIHLEFYQYINTASAEEEGFTYQLKEAFLTGFNETVRFVILLVYIWPLLVLLALAYVLRSRFSFKRITPASK